MLVLSRKIGEVITVGSSVKITVLSFDRGVVRLGIEAPKTIPVHRKEVYDKIIELNKKAAKTNIMSLKTAISNNELKLKNADKKQHQNLLLMQKNIKDDYSQNR